MSGWRTALRLARREARRARGRATLVIAMIMLPVAALSFAAVVYDTFELTPAEEADRLMGTAEALVAWPFGVPVEQATGSLSSSAQSPGEPVDPTTDHLLTLLPAGTRAIPDLLGGLSVRTTGGTGTLDVRALDYADPLASGILRQVAGRAPRSADEVALTQGASGRTGAGVGESVRLADGSRTFRVVGIVEDLSKLDATTIVLRPGAVPAETMSASGVDARWLVATPNPLTWAEVKRLNTHGVVAVSRHVLANPPSAAEAYTQQQADDEPPPGTYVLIGGLVVLQVVLLAGPALAVGARRRRRDLALVAAAGGTTSHVRRIVLADGVVLGGLAAVTGVALGVGAAVALLPLMEGANNIRAAGFRVFPRALIGLAVLAVVTGVLAALVPAWLSARRDVVAGLTGRRGITRSRRRWLVLGAGMVAVGVGVCAFGASGTNLSVVLIGMVLAQLGLVLCTPSIIGLVARLGRWLPVAPRIALRDTARNRTAAAPAISAVMAAVVGSVAISVVLGGLNARTDDESAGRPGDVSVYRVDDVTKAGDQQGLRPEAVAAIRDVLPVDQVVEIKMPACGTGGCLAHPKLPPRTACPYAFDVLHREPTEDEQRAARADPDCEGVGRTYEYFATIGTPFGLLVVVPPSAAAAVTDIPVADRDRVAAALRAGSVVVSDARYLDRGRVTLVLEEVGVAGEHTVSAPAVALSRPPKAPIALATEEALTRLGIGPTWTTTTLVTTTRMPTVDEEDRLRAALGSGYEVRVNRGESASDPALLMLAVVAGVIALGAAALATGLAAADGRADLGTLAAVGASPRLRRALSLSQSGVIAGLGSLLGVAAGLGGAAAVLFAFNQGQTEFWPAKPLAPIVVPWVNVGVALVVVPAIAMLGAGLFTRSRLPIERRL